MCENFCINEFHQIQEDLNIDNAIEQELKEEIAIPLCHIDLSKFTPVVSPQNGYMLDYRYVCACGETGTALVDYFLTSSGYGVVVDGLARMPALILRLKILSNCLNYCSQEIVFLNDTLSGQVFCFGSRERRGRNRNGTENYRVLGRKVYAPAEMEIIAQARIQRRISPRMDYGYFIPECYGGMGMNLEDFIDIPLLASIAQKI